MRIYAIQQITQMTNATTLLLPTMKTLFPLDEVPDAEVRELLTNESQSKYIMDGY